MPVSYSKYTLYKDSVACRLLWLYLYRSNYKPYVARLGRHAVSLLPGQVVCGRKELSQELNVTESAIRSANRILTECQLIAIKTTRHYSVITILDWPESEPDSEAKRQQNANKEPTASHLNTTNLEKEVKQALENKVMNVLPQKEAPPIIIPTQTEAWRFADLIDHDGFDGRSFEESEFYLYCEKRGWRFPDGYPMDWKRIMWRFKCNSEGNFVQEPEDEEFYEDYVREG